MSTFHSVPLRMALCAAFGLAVVPAIGAGFALEEGSARGNVNPAGLIAGGGEPASLYFNGATMTELPGTQVELGASFIRPEAEVLAVNPYTGERMVGAGHRQIWSLPSAYATHQL